jgi:hypothetical protein
MGTTRYVRRFVLDLTIETSRKSPPSDYMLRAAVEECLSGLNQKKHKLGDVRALAVPLTGFAERVIDFLEVLRAETCPGSGPTRPRRGTNDLYPGSASRRPERP